MEKLYLVPGGTVYVIICNIWVMNKIMCVFFFTGSWDPEAEEWWVGPQVQTGARECWSKGISDTT